MNQKLLVMVGGPTGVGKSDFAIRLAKMLNTSIISCDSRQFYNEMLIGTARLTTHEQQNVQHFFMGDRSVTNPLTAGQFEKEVENLLNHELAHKKVVVVVGGSGLYYDALVNGIEDLPKPSDEQREQVRANYNDFGLTFIQNQLKNLDPTTYQQTDIANPSRVMRAIELCLATNQPISQIKQGRKPKPYNRLLMAINDNRHDLHSRIDQRVNIMMNNGLIDEVKGLYHLRNHQALQTVGYSELFDYMNGLFDLKTAIENIKAHTRQYARRQITWFNRYPDLVWLHRNQVSEAYLAICSLLCI